MLGIVNVKRTKEKSVYFVGLRGGAFIVKCSDTVEREFFSSELYKVRQRMTGQMLGVPTPDCRVLSFYEEQYKTLQFNVDKLSVSDMQLNSEIRADFNRPFLLLMQYIPSITVSQLGVQRANRVLNPAFQEARRNILNLGQMMATDILLNIPHRYANSPQYYLEDLRKLDSVLVEVDVFDQYISEDFKSAASNVRLQGLYGIDVLCNCLSQEEENWNIVKGAYEDMDRCLASTDSFLNDFFTQMRELQSDGVDLENFSFYSIRIIKQVLENFLLTPNPNTWVTLMNGILLGLANIVSVDLKSVTSLHMSCAGYVAQDYKHKWAEGMSTIHLNFLTEMFQIIKKHCDVNLSLIGEILQQLPPDLVLKMPPKVSPRRSIESLPSQKESGKKSPKKKKSGKRSESPITPHTPGSDLDAVDFNTLTPPPANPPPIQIESIEDVKEQPIEEEEEKQSELVDVDSELQRDIEEPQAQPEKPKKKEKKQKKKKKNPRSKGCRIL